MSNDSSAYTFYIQLPFGPAWPHVEILRTSILNCLLTVFQHLDFCHAAGMVASELLENAIHYGDWSNDGARGFRLEVRANKTQVFVTVSNPVDPDGEALQRLRSVIDRLQSTPPGEAYMERLRAISDGDTEKSRLGLVRCAFEAGCKLSLELDSNVVRVRGEVSRGSE